MLRAHAGPENSRLTPEHAIYKSVRNFSNNLGTPSNNLIKQPAPLYTASWYRTRPSLSIKKSVSKPKLQGKRSEEKKGANHTDNKYRIWPW
jgi:hypothetical protein